MKRRRPRGHECRTCLAVLAESYPDSAKSDLLASMSQPIDDDDSGLTRREAEFLPLVNSTEAGYEKGDRGRGKRTGVSKITMQQVHGGEARTKLGVFWPKDIYEGRFIEPIPPGMREWRRTGKGGKNSSVSP